MGPRRRPRGHAPHQGCFRGARDVHVTREVPAQLAQACAAGRRGEPRPCLPQVPVSALRRPARSAPQ
eukprot:14998590-Alexandrium_andersonii.AAC.1